jgi:hypothetical protein
MIPSLWNQNQIYFNLFYINGIFKNNPDQFLSGVVEEFYLNSYLQFQLFENLKSNKF